ncbi:chromate transporter [Clostridium sp. SYSU_GA19001]|uniref:chromate transporter n=1 Tax=Clostridium caldaquaticum TaxID=2940653 RepID=UPI0020772242|nr:chromate transporter [Clostridium caldaquaticum]MCM8710147.1 chromate transporter [Clostridium caldaquaticum]
MKKYFEMFYSFFKIGAFTIGGGYAMIPLIEKEIVDKNKWINREDFLDMLALAQSAPGPIAINTAVFAGYKMAGIPGMIFTVLGSVLPSLLIILIIASFFVGIKDNAAVERVFKGIRPAVVALIAAPILRFGKAAKINKKTIIIPVAVAALVAFVNVTPVIIIIAAVALGVLYGRNKGDVK